ncbi:MAG TPA: histidine--tRNA ligase [Mycobacteriales bacterium]|nr:histidine--tRNA ligase [Mycobacteriales bacterium]
MSTYRAPRGTYDLLPPMSGTHLAVRGALAAGLQRAGYGYIETPTFEDTALFTRGVGESTDVVSKEMYSFDDRAGRSITLRPEGTAPVLRAALEAGLQQGQLPVKLWYVGSFYRYERMQKGRYRHFAQVGAEALGSDDPALDAELIWLADRAFRDLGLRRTRLLLNSLGDRESRAAYRSRLVAFLDTLELDEPTRQRAALNPLRVLDDKRPQLQEALEAAPVLADSLNAACRAHHDAVRQYLTDLGVPYQDAPRLVRGLDYYTRTTFEFVHDGLGAQSALGGGGRYDGLSELLGGPPLPSIGWALGVDRTVLALEAEGIEVASGARCAVYVVPLGEQARRRSVTLVAALRQAGVATDVSYGDRGLKGAMKAADRSGARYAVVLGERDLANGTVACKDLNSGEQVAVPIEQLTDELKGRLA